MKYWVLVGGVLLAVGVMIGAMGSHFFAEALEATNGREPFFRAHNYYMFHAIGILLVGIIGSRDGSTMWNIPAALFLAGIFLFSATIMLKYIGWTDSSSAAPFGGISFMLGWLAFAWLGFRQK